MAEFVQNAMEEMLPELEQMKRTQLFTAEEVRLLRKKRQRFEYLIQKQEKRKVDFLNYIQEELILLDLVELKRERIGYHGKKGTIDFAIIRRINKLFKILERRFYEDVNIWITHISVLRRMASKDKTWRSEAGKIFRAMLKYHMYKEELWLRAAMFEMEEDEGIENARKLLLEGLRYNAQSKNLWREYFSLELKFLSDLKNEESAKALPDESREDVLAGKIPREVFLKTAEEIPEAEFLCSMLKVTKDFDFMETNREEKFSAAEMESYLQGHFPDSDLVWDSSANLALPKDSSALTLASLKSCVSIYDQGLSKVEDKTNLISMKLETLFSLVPDAPEDCRQFIFKELLATMKKACEDETLMEKYFKDLVFLVEDKNELRELKNFPSSLI